MASLKEELWSDEDESDRVFKDGGFYPSNVLYICLPTIMHGASRAPMSIRRGNSICAAFACITIRGGASATRVSAFLNALEKGAIC